MPPHSINQSRTSTVLDSPVKPSFLGLAAALSVGVRSSKKIAPAISEHDHARRHPRMQPSTGNLSGSICVGSTQVRL